MTAMVVAVLAAAAVVGCGGSSLPRSAAASEVTRQHALSLSVLAIEARIGRDLVRGAGAVIAGPRGLVLTSAHSVWGVTSLKVLTGVGLGHGRVVARAPCDDLALLETQPRVPGLASVAAAPGGLSSSEPLIAVGRRATGADVGSRSLVSIPVRASGGGVRVLGGLRLRALDGAARLDSDLVSEATGGPLLDRRGRPVGMAVVAVPAQRTSTAVALPSVRVATSRHRGPRPLMSGFRGWQRAWA